MDLLLLLEKFEFRFRRGGTKETGSGSQNCLFCASFPLSKGSNATTDKKLKIKTI